MQQLSEMDLPEIDLFAPEYTKDPHAVYSRAREKSWIAKYQFGYIVLDYNAMKDFLVDEARLRVPNKDIVKAWHAEGTPFDRFQGNHLQTLRGDTHRRIRNLVAPAFTPRTANQHREVMRETLEKILDGAVPEGHCDFARVSAQYPITVMCHLIGVPTEDVKLFAHWLEEQEAAYAQDASVLPRLNESLTNLLEYVTRLIQERKRPGEHPNDLLQNLVELSDHGDSLNDEELIILLALLLAGGYDTTKNQLTLMMKMMVDQPAEWERLASDPSYVKPFIEETLRYLGTLGSTHRVANEEIVYRDVVIPAGTFITLPLTYGGRDPEVFDDPETFRPGREGARTLVFGQGPHICLGQFLARALLEEGLPIVVRRLPRPHVAGTVEYRSPMGVWGCHSLPIAFEPEPVHA